MTTRDTPIPPPTPNLCVLLPSPLSLQCLNESLGPKDPNSKKFFPAPQLSNCKNTKYSRFLMYPEIGGDQSPQNLLLCSPRLSIALLTHLTVEAKSLTPPKCRSLFKKLETCARSPHTPGEPALVPASNRKATSRQERAPPRPLIPLPLLWVLHTWVTVSLEGRLWILGIRS